jgi:hypothetical protein
MENARSDHRSCAAVYLLVDGAPTRLFAPQSLQKGEVRVVAAAAGRRRRSALRCRARRRRRLVCFVSQHAYCWPLRNPKLAFACGMDQVLGGKEFEPAQQKCGSAQLPPFPHRRAKTGCWPWGAQTGPARASILSNPINYVDEAVQTLLQWLPASVAAPAATLGRPTAEAGAGRGWTSRGRHHLVGGGKVEDPHARRRLLVASWRRHGRAARCVLWICREQRAL